MWCGENGDSTVDVTGKSGDAFEHSSAPASACLRVAVKAVMQRIHVHLHVVRSKSARPDCRKAKRQDCLG